MSRRISIGRFMAPLLAGAIATAGIAATSGCAAPKKPAELVKLERLLHDRPRAAALPETRLLLEQAAAEHDTAIVAWRDGELDESRQQAILATLKVRSARAIVERLATARRVAQLKAEVAVVKERRVRLAERLEDLDEKIRVYEDLAVALVDTKLKAMDLTEAQQQIKAQQTIEEAELGVKRADTVDAAEYATTNYTLAQQLIESAGRLLKEKKAAEAIKTAALAKAKADAAFQQARPRFVNAKQAAQQRERNAALQKEAAAIEKLKPRLETKEETQRLLLPVDHLFSRGAADLRRARLQVLNAISTLLKKYDEYPVIINGYASSAVPRAKRFTLSRSRAYAVLSYLQTFGHQRNRFAVQARGAARRLSRTQPGSALNDGVEIELLFPAVDAGLSAPPSKQPAPSETGTSPKPPSKPIGPS